MPATRAGSPACADLRGQEKIEADSIAEAVNYRSLDRNLWQ